MEDAVSGLMVTTLYILVEKNGFFRQGTFTLSFSLSTKVYKWVQGQIEECLNGWGEGGGL